ncbi:MAG: YicC/YloC family endoribonuclease [Marinilabiliaceae bacterium]|nr:YicC/YloC family endoribonuclease [Marinilabiliaceae bacterium]
MIKSMTGFGKSTASFNGKKITVEIRALNSKQADINLKMPWLYKEKELDIRNIISEKIERGKVDFSLFVDTTEQVQAPKINSAVVRSYFEQLKEVAGELYIDNNDELLSIIMRLPETLSTGKEELSKEEWEVLSEIINDALGKLESYRIEEGKALGMDIGEKIQRILRLLDDIDPYENERTDKIRERISKSLADSGAEDIDMNRFEQELIYYLEKLDINEEKVRLRKNCEHFLETMDMNESNGKKLGFISQEIGREINTIGSKANHSSIQRIVVMMKDELEKIKEQVLNIL